MKRNKKADNNASTSGPLPAVLNQDETIAALRDEIGQLREELERLRIHHAPSPSDTDWESEMEQGIVYTDGHSPTSSISAGRLLKQFSGLSKERMKSGQIRDSREIDYLPIPSVDEAQLEADFIRWGYCLVKDAMSAEQVREQVERLVDQAAAERQRSAAIVTSESDNAQLVNNLVLKG
ncbi:MAG: hypothetical protein VX211_04530, partial [Pseudomonadota bacterium]|nr:hypothetical protein [Pseudomonadota bacterium]